MSLLSNQIEAIVALLQKNRFSEAIDYCREILVQTPKQPDALYYLALTAFLMHQPANAIEWLDMVREEDPERADAWLLRARVLRMLRRPEEAVAAAERATQRASGSVDAWHCAGFMKMAVGKWEEARQDLARAVQLAPDNPVLRSQYALTLNENNQNAAAYAEVQQALAQAPGHMEVLMTKADILDSAGYYDLAARYRPQDKIVTFNQAANFFLTGSFEKGLEFIAARNEAQHNAFPDMPRWQGDEDFGLHVLLTGEQGYGDIIQFVRYAPLLRDKVGKVSLRVPYRLARLLRESMPSIPLVVFPDATQDTVREPLPSGATEDLPGDITAQCSLMSLPRHLQTKFDPVSSSVPYLKADPLRVEVWRERLAAIPRPWIGFGWSGNPRHTNDHKRSMPLDALSPLLDLARPHLVSLQFGDERVKTLDCYDAVPFITDFADSAALLEALDLLIMIDSAPAHLAGALGRPVWTLLPFNPDWRWLLGREDSIWYPSMRLFRQPEPGDWNSVVTRICKDVNLLIKGQPSVLEPQVWTEPPLKRHPQALDLPGIKDEMQA